MGAGGGKLRHVKKENPVNTWMIQEALGSGSYGKVTKVSCFHFVWFVVVMMVVRRQNTSDSGWPGLLVCWLQGGASHFPLVPSTANDAGKASGHEPACSGQGGTHPGTGGAAELCHGD